MRDIMKYALRLMLFAAAAGLLLSVVNAVTEGPIAEQVSAKVNAAREAVIGKYEFTPLEADLSKYPMIQSVYTASAGDEVAGYVYELKGKGYGGEVSFSMGVNTSGAVTGITISTHKETKGLGTAAQKKFLSSFYGMAADPKQVAQLDGMTGATISTNAIKSAATQALTFSREELGIPAKADPYLAYNETPDPETVSRKAISQMLPGAELEKLDFFVGYRTLNALYFAHEGDGSLLYVYRAVSTMESGRANLLIVLDGEGKVREVRAESYEEGLTPYAAAIDQYLSSLSGISDVEEMPEAPNAALSREGIAENIREAQTHLKSYLAEGGTDK